MKQISWGEIRTRLRQNHIRRKEKSEAKMEARRNSKFGQKLQKAFVVMNRFSLLLHAVWAWVLYFVIEAISRHSVEKAWNFMVGSVDVYAFNTFMIFATFFVVYIVRRRVFARIIISALWLLIGIVNGYMLSVRVTPFNAQDLKMVTDVILPAYRESSSAPVFCLPLPVWFMCGDGQESSGERCIAFQRH